MWSNFWSPTELFQYCQYRHAPKLCVYLDTAGFRQVSSKSRKLQVRFTGRTVKRINGRLDAPFGNHNMQRVKPFRPNGISYCNQFDQSISILRGVRVVSFVNALFADDPQKEHYRLGLYGLRKHSLFITCSYPVHLE